MPSHPFTEVADRVWVARYEQYDVNVGVVGGERGLVVVDTHGNEAAAREVVGHVRALDRGEVVAVVNTHEHFDHVFGNGTFREEYGADLPIHATEQCAERTRDTVPADHTFSSAAVVDLGDRYLELVHPGRGHTGGDLVVRVPDADALLAGDLVEESGPPAYGDDSYPLEWPLALDLVVGMLTPASVVVPGHGAVVDRAFVQDQRAAIGVVAETIRHLAESGVRVEDALAEAEWPFPADRLADAVRRGYAQLPRSQRRLPLL